MAKKITRDRLVEPGTFESIQRDGEALIQLATRISEAYEKAAIAQKSTLSGGMPKNMSDLTQMDDTIKKTNEYYIALGKIEKHKAQIQQTAEKARLAEIKLEQDREKAFDKYEAKLKKKQADEEKASREYVKQSKILNELKNNYRDIALALGQDSAEAKKLLAQLTPLDQKLKAIDKSVGNFHREVGNYRQSLTDAREGLMQIASAAGLAFGVHQVIDFGKESVHAFLEAEKNARGLYNAVHQNTVVYDKLMKQSEELQDRSIFSDDDIQIAQKQLAVFGLTGEQIEKLTPQIIDLASKMDMDLNEATKASISAINGQTKGLKQAGITFKDTGSKTENLALLTEKLTKFQGGAAQALETTIGKTQRLANAWDNVKEAIGEYLVNEGAKVLDNLEALANAANVFVSQESDKFIKAMETVNKKTLENAQKSELDRLKAVAETEKNIAALTKNMLASRNEAEKKLRTNLLNNQLKLREDLRKLNEKESIEDDATSGADKDKKLKAEEDYAKKLRDLQTENIRISFERRKKQIDDNFDDETKKYAGHTEILAELQIKRLNAQEDLYREHQKEMQAIRDNAIKQDGLKPMEAQDVAFSKSVETDIKNWEEEQERKKKQMEEEQKMAIDHYEDLLEIYRAYHENKNEEQLSAIDSELEKNQTAIERQQALADQGKNNTLAFEMQERDRLEKKRVEELERQEQQMKKQEALELSLAFLKAYENYIGKDMKSSEALGRAFADVTSAKILGKVLAGSAEDGTEDTGDYSGPGLDGKGGSLWMLHPKERVMTAEQNAALKGLSNEEVVQRALMADNFNSSMMMGDLSRASAQNQSLNMMVVKEVQAMHQTIKDKPENSVHWTNFGTAVNTEVKKGIRTITHKQTFIP